MGISRGVRRQIAAEAVDWFLSLQETSSDGSEREGFSEWLLRSPVHVEEYLQVSSTWHLANTAATGSLDPAALVAAAKAHHENDNLVALPGRLLPDARRRRRQSRRGFANLQWWTALVASVVLGILWVSYQSWKPPLILQTAVGEQKSLTLQDGSVVFLNTSSEVSVVWRLAQRHIELVRGEARFQVAKRRLLTVATAAATIRGLDSVFNVRVEPMSTQVAVLEGQVEVTVASTSEPLALPIAVTANAPQSPTIERVRLRAGERVAVTPGGGIQTDIGPPIETVAAWTQRRLVFRDQTLGTVLSEFNRYRTHPLVLDDPVLSSMRISGAFDSNDPDSLLAYLGIYETVQVDRRGDGSARLFRSPAR